MLLWAPEIWASGEPEPSPNLCIKIFLESDLYQRGHIVRFWHQNLPLRCDDLKHHTHGCFDQTRDVQRYEL